MKCTYTVYAMLEDAVNWAIRTFLVWMRHVQKTRNQAGSYIYRGTIYLYHYCFCCSLFCILALGKTISNVKLPPIFIQQHQVRLKVRQQVCFSALLLFPSSFNSLCFSSLICILLVRIIDERKNKKITSSIIY